ncbi:6-bladed beta-propeller [bacterium]|nr:6-bladed beta-propeller [bacterium]
MKHCHRKIPLTALIVLVAVGAAAEVPRVTNGAEPRDGMAELQLEEIWRHGGIDDEEVLFGLVTSVVTDDEGNLYVLDAQLAEVMVFSPDGEFLRTIGRQGSGPGEFQTPQQLAMLPGGGVGVTQMFPGKLVGLNLDGTPLGDVTIGDATAGEFAVLINVASGGGNLVVSGMELGFDQATMSQDRHMFVRSYDLDGTMQQEYVSGDQTWVFDSSFVLRETESDFVWWRLAVDHQGRVVVGEPREDYEISVYAADGTLQRVFGREYETLERTEAIKARFRAMLDAQTGQLPPGTETEVAERAQDIWGIHCHADGSYWVTSSRGMYEPPEGALVMWDVFSPEGEFVRQVHAKVPGQPGTDRLLLTDHGYAVKITGFWDAVLSAMGAGGQSEEAEPMEIVCYRIGEM